MKKAALCAFLLVLIFAVTAAAVDWQENPVFLRGVETSTIFTSYGATFGSGDSSSSGFSFNSRRPYSFFLTADRNIYDHSLSLGYVHVLSPTSNLGFFVTHGLAYGWSEGTDSETYISAGAASRILDDYTNKTLTHHEGFTAAYSHGVSDRIAWGASFTYDYSESSDAYAYTTIAAVVAPFATDPSRDLDFVDRRFKSYLGATAGLAVVPAGSLELDFVVEAGGFFGERRYQENNFNSLWMREMLDYDSTGDYSGFHLRAGLSGTWRISDSFSVPFSVGYVRDNGREAYDGLGEASGGMIGAVTPYYRDYDRWWVEDSVRVGAGLNYYPFADPAKTYFYLRGNYRYYNGMFDVESDLGSPTGFPITPTKADGSTAYENHTIGVLVGVTVPIGSGFAFSGGINYRYTFLNIHDRQNQYELNGVTHVYDLIGFYDYGGDGYEQYIATRLGLTYVRGNLSLSLTTNIPILSESDYTLTGPNYAGVGIGNIYAPARFSSKRMDWDVIFGLSWSF